MSETPERDRLEATLAGLGIVVNDESLEHYGIKGMRWGKRKSGGSDSSSSSSASPKKTVKDLSDDELKTMINRIKLEQEFVRLTTPGPSKGRKFAEDFLTQQAKQQLPVVLGATGKVIKGLMETSGGKHRA